MACFAFETVFSSWWLVSGRSGNLNGGNMVEERATSVQALRTPTIPCSTGHVRVSRASCWPVLMMAF